jgi:SAM-dependent methyltransferase
MHLKYRKTCRACGSTSLTKVIDLGVQHLQGGFLDPKAPVDYSNRKIPMSLVRCDSSVDEKACGLLQTDHGVPPELMYRRYWYRSGTNQTMKSHLESIVYTAANMHAGVISNALDIGCNDGTLLGFYDSNTKLVGIDPSNIIPESNDAVTYIRDFFPSEELRVKFPSSKFDVITSIAMFYDLDDPGAFVAEIARLLSPNGLWVVEVSYMPQMIEQGSYDSICHEHLLYFSLASLEGLFEKHNLQIVRAELNDMNGGSIRCFVTHKSCLDYKNEEDLSYLQLIRVKEFDQELDTNQPYLRFQALVEENRHELSELVRYLRAQGKKIHLYGASTKGNTILQWCNLTADEIEYAADRNPAKNGLITPGSRIPIVSEEESRSMNPDYYLVLPWHFRAEFLERERDAIARGVKFIFPLPRVEIFGKDGAKSSDRSLQPA